MVDTNELEAQAAQQGGPPLGFEGDGEEEQESDAGSTGQRHIC
jgi:hypothetical protein